MLCQGRKSIIRRMNQHAEIDGRSFTKPLTVSLCNSAQVNQLSETLARGGRHSETTGSDDTFKGKLTTMTNRSKPTNQPMAATKCDSTQAGQLKQSLTCGGQQLVTYGVDGTSQVKLPTETSGVIRLRHKGNANATCGETHKVPRLKQHTETGGRKSTKQPGIASQYISTQVSYSSQTSTRGGRQIVSPGSVDPF